MQSKTCYSIIKTEKIKGKSIERGTKYGRRQNHCNSRERERERERVVILTNNKQAKKLALLSILRASTKHGNV